VTEQDVTQSIREFIKTFLPEEPIVERNGVRILLTPHNLVYDFHDDYGHIRFTAKQTIRCLQAFLPLLDPVKNVILNLESE
jgi:hypothetical protein